MILISSAAIFGLVHDKMDTMMYSVVFVLMTNTMYKIYSLKTL